MWGVFLTDFRLLAIYASYVDEDWIIWNFQSNFLQTESIITKLKIIWGRSIQFLNIFNM